jgi:RNA polymerase sigma-70 factor, ECF subfamily
MISHFGLRPMNMADALLERPPVASNSVALREAPAATGDLESYRRELTGYCYRMLGSGFEAEDAVQETMLRAWRNAQSFEGRSSLRSWLYRIATNVCIDMHRQVQRRTRPIDMGPAYRESVRLAFVTALQHLPARQRAALILCEVLRWQVVEVAELLDTSVAAVNSSLQRARATLRTTQPEVRSEPLDDNDSELLDRYMEAFERYDIERLVNLLREDAFQSMPPFAMWVQGAADIGRFMLEPGPSGCRGSRLVPISANGCPGFAQYKPDPAGGYAPWAIQVLEISKGKIVAMNFFLALLDPERLFPQFGLPLHLDV